MRIALVDPSRTIVQIVASLLEQRAHAVHRFHSATATLRHLRDEPETGVLITSNELDEMSGVELCWQARLLASTARPLHILMMSSNDDPMLLSQALDSGADDFMRKPPVAGELFARLRAAERLAVLQREAHRLATEDPLTGLLNRRAFFADAMGRGGPGCEIGVVMLDLDHFKSINDRHGHAVGDEVLRRAAAVLKRHCPTAGRLGGEEFALFLPHRSRESLHATAEAIRLEIGAIRIPLAAAPDNVLTVSASFGVAVASGPASVDSVLRDADLALYAAKAAGRDRTVSAPQNAPAAAASRTRKAVRSVWTNPDMAQGLQPRSWAVQADG